MSQIQRIIFPVDFSERCRQIAPVVRFWARHFDAAVTVFHSYSAPYGDREFVVLQEAMHKELRQIAQNAIRKFAAQELSGLENVTTVVDEGDPGRVATRLVQQAPGAMVMMPTHGYGGFRRFLVGSVAGKILHDVECPVWTAPHDETIRCLQPVAPKVIVCGVDRHRSAIPLIKRAEWLARKFGATLKLAHALPAVNESSDNRGERAVRRHWETRAQQELQPWIVEAGSKAELILHGGNISDALAEVAAVQKADLLMIGRGHMRKRLGRLRTHSLAIISKSHCPVLSV